MDNAAYVSDFLFFSSLSSFTNTCEDFYTIINTNAHN